MALSCDARIFQYIKRKRPIKDNEGASRNRVSLLSINSDACLAL